MGLQRVVTLTRIEGGLAFRAPGVALVLRADRVLVAHWTRAPEELRMVQDWLTQRIGRAYPIEDGRPVAAPGVVGHAVKPQERDADRIVPDPVEPEHRHEVEDEAATHTPPVDDDLGPGF